MGPRERRHAVVHVGKALDVPCVAPPDGNRGEHGPRVVVDDVERIPRRVHDFVTGLEHLLRWEVDRPPVEVNHIRGDLVLTTAERWPFPHQGASALTTHEGIHAVDEAPLDLGRNAVRLVSTDVHVGRGAQHRKDLGQQRLETVLSLRARRQLRRCLAKDLGVRATKDRRVTRDVDLRHQRDAARLAIGLERDEVLPGPTGARTAQLGKRARRPREQLVVRQVQMEVIDLVVPGHVDDVPQGLWPVGMASHVDHEAAEWSVRGVSHFEPRPGHLAALDLHALEEGCGCVRDTLWGLRANHDLATAQIDAVRGDAERTILDNLDGARRRTSRGERSPLRTELGEGLDQGSRLRRKDRHIAMNYRTGNGRTGDGLQSLGRRHHLGTQHRREREARDEGADHRGPPHR